MKCKENETVKIKPGDKITFGTNHSKCCFEFSILPMHIYVSNVPKESISELQLLIAQIGHLSENIEDCTYLLMDELKITSKVILALILAKPIVNIEWLKQVVEKPSPSTPLPDVKKYNFLNLFFH